MRTRDVQACQPESVDVRAHRRPRRHLVCDSAFCSLNTGHAAFRLGPVAADVAARDPSAWEVFRHAKRLYSRMGFAERVSLLENDEGHNYNTLQREGAVRWMSRAIAVTVAALVPGGTMIVAWNHAGRQPMTATSLAFTWTAYQPTSSAVNVTGSLLRMR